VTETLPFPQPQQHTGSYAFRLVPRHTQPAVVRALTDPPLLATVVCLPVGWHVRVCERLQSVQFVDSLWFGMEADRGAVKLQGHPSPATPTYRRMAAAADREVAAGQGRARWVAPEYKECRGGRRSGHAGNSGWVHAQQGMAWQA